MCLAAKRKVKQLLCDEWKKETDGRCDEMAWRLGELGEKKVTIIEGPLFPARRIKLLKLAGMEYFGLQRTCLSQIGRGYLPQNLSCGLRWLLMGCSALTQPCSCPAVKVLGSRQFQADDDN